MVLIERDGEWFRIDGIGKKTVHLERVEIGEIRYTEDYRQTSREAFKDQLDTHLLAMREQEKEFKKSI